MGMEGNPFALLIGGLVMFVFLKFTWDQTIRPLVVDPISNWLNRRRLERIHRDIKRFEANKPRIMAEFAARQRDRS